MILRAGPTASRGLRLRSHRTVLFSRVYGSAAQGPPKTYFQPTPEPPRPRFRLLRSLLLGSTCFVLGFVASEAADDALVDEAQEAELLDDVATMSMPELVGMKTAYMREIEATHCPPHTVESATMNLAIRSGFSVTPTAVAHNCQMPSNLPCEDTLSSGVLNYHHDVERDWCEWSIFDGHAGPRTSHLLTQILPREVGRHLAESGSLDRPYVLGDSAVSDTLKQAFRFVDEEILNPKIQDAPDGAQTSILQKGDEIRRGSRWAEALMVLSGMMSGSCALMALFDPVNGVLRVANTGDSRAVLGRWEDGKYVARPMSVDQTGFNPDEVARLRNEHPGEDVVDEKTGRVFGLAVTRAFGDSRWKWSEELTRKIHQTFWGPAPRPNGAIKTPPYLTAEPEIQETKVQTGKRPDFLILASDGLWDLMSNEDAVACVQAWLGKNKPTDFLRHLEGTDDGLGVSPPNSLQLPNNPLFQDTQPDKDEDLYYDEEEKTLKWCVSPKHFVVEDENAGMHLIKNAFGGKRRRLYEALMSVQPPLSRNVRDDVTVQVVFFGVEAGDAAKKIAEVSREIEMQGQVGKF